MNRQKFYILVLLISVVMVSTLSISRTIVQASSWPYAVPDYAYSVYLPLVRYFCTPDPPGESDNIYFPLAVCSGQTVSGQVSEEDLDDVYRILSKANQKLTVSMDGSGGDADLFLFPPGTTDMDSDPWAAASGSEGNTEFIQYTILEGGFWYIDVFSYSGTTNYNLTITLSSP